MIYFMNGELHEDEVCLDLAQPPSGLDTVFETVCWNGSKICHLDLHLERARSSLAEFGVAEAPLDYEAVIGEVIKANGLLNEICTCEYIFSGRERSDPADRLRCAF